MVDDLEDDAAAGLLCLFWNSLAPGGSMLVGNFAPHCPTRAYMDWIGNWRFHFVEVVVYRSLLYPFAAFFGFDVQAMFWYGVVSVLGGHFAHANLRCSLGPLRYVVNTPDMHAWHHTHPEAGPPDHNFGIVLSVWDWIFGTAYMPRGRMPARLGFTGIEHYPHNVFGHLVAPIKPGR